MEIHEENGQKYYRNVKYLQNAHAMYAVQNTMSANCGFEMCIRDSLYGL